MRCSRAPFAAASIGVAMLSSALAAQAKEQFPNEMARNLGLHYAPPCRVCHIQGTTGAGSVAAPFGVSMLAHGMTGSGSSLPPALDAMRADMTDSDGDGQPDIAELIADRDPNTPADVPLVGEDPRYGCSVAAAEGSRPWNGAVAALLLSGVLFSRSRRRSRRQGG